MEDKLSFYSIAKQCQGKYENQINSQGDFFKYVGTRFASIDSKGKVLISETPEILLKEDVQQCVLVHEHSRKEVSNWYSWYTIEFIDNDKCVHREKLNERFKLFVNYHQQFNNQWIHLYSGDQCIYECKWPNDGCLQKIWNLYQKCQLIETNKEAKVVGELLMMDDLVLSLKQDLANVKYSNLLLTKERDQYKSLLDEIKEMVHSK